ncbi:MAG: DUF1311 domain-containing protein [Roseburia sp.]|nr:DUF1311 domain-containing protein [Roseburia sp.]MDY5884074.1 lysozyme inhibitor LprI family protein [Roseburia sp.]
MKRKFVSKGMLVGVAGTLLVALAACQPGETKEKTPEAAQQEKTVLEMESTSEPIQETQTSETEQDTTEENLGFSFSDLKNVQFVFSSGVGGWCTTLDIAEDGSFSGVYHDSDMGDTGDGYPNGTYYYAEFTGKFAQLKQIDDTTYETSIESIQLKQTAGEEEIIDGMKYVYSEPYGLDGAKEIRIYTKDAKVANLPEGFVSWVRYNQELGETLDCYGLYNVAAEEGFVGWEYEEDAADAATDINDELAAVEKQAKEIEDKLQGDDLTQGDYNILTGQLFNVWDDELNAIWSRLKDTLSEEEMEKLTKEEREWIADKEEQVKEAGLDAEGGTMQPMLENDKAAELTRERVYELADYLSEK